MGPAKHILAQSIRFYSLNSIFSSVSAEINLFLLHTLTEIRHIRRVCHEFVWSVWLHYVVSHWIISYVCELHDRAEPKADFATSQFLTR